MSLYLGFDLSTQQLKIVSTHEDLSFHSKYAIDLDEFSKEFGTTKGVLGNAETGEVVSPVKMFIKAIQTLLDRMKKEHFPFERVKSVSGSCQQHGTVFYSSEIAGLLGGLSGESDSWDCDLSSGFSFANASNWQDRSTGNEILDFEKALGGANELCHVTGSRAHYRFSGLQMRRRAKENSPEWKKTQHIGLISSFLDSFLTGRLRGIEVGEACGTNLFDIEKDDWNDELLSLVVVQNSKVDGVSKEKEVESSRTVRGYLGDVVRPGDCQPIARYLVERYNFNKECAIWPITGDNLATIMSLPLRKDDLLISMGTSTTVLLLTEKYIPSVNYHMFKHPVCPNLYMGMLCYCNGSLAREQIRDEINRKYNTTGWDQFDEILDGEYLQGCTAKGDVCKVGLFFPLGEIIPNAKAGKHVFQYDGESTTKELGAEEVSIEEESLLIVESQALSNRLRVCPLLSDSDADTISDAVVKRSLGEIEAIAGERVDVDSVYYDAAEFVKRPNSVYYVGGTSKNKSILRVYNDILGPRNNGFRVEIGDACALGGCFRAIWGSTGGDVGFEEWIEKMFHFDENVDVVPRNSSLVEDRWSHYAVKMSLLSHVEQTLRSQQQQ